MLFICIVVAMLSAHVMFAQGDPPEFRYPIEGQLGVDYFLVNHVDQDPVQGAIRDYACGKQTYDGHQGTDFVLASFRQMDSGVHVLAASKGRVIAVVDTFPDRNKVSVVARGFGNYIALEHPGNWISYYAHNRATSALVRVGDTVEAGQRIALVGSSGNSEDPHVHFEVWRVVDPFSGTCSESQSLWRNQPVYRTDLRVIDAGLTTWPPALDTLRERPPTVSTIVQSDSSITAWALAQGLRPTDRYRIVWLAPDGTQWFSFEADAGRESNYMYWWSWIRRPDVNGRWNVVITVNAKEVYRASFDVTGVVGVPEGKMASYSLEQHRDVIRVHSVAPVQVEVYNMRGVICARHDLHSTVGAFVLPEATGTYLVVVRRGLQIVARSVVSRTD